MSIDLATPVVGTFVNAQPDADRTPRLDVKSSYDGSNVVYRLMRMETWGPSLMNLGYYRFGGILSLLNYGANQELAQRRLVMKAVKLLNVGKRHRVLDVACGRGKSSFMVSCMNPDASVVGLDLLDRNVQVAETLFDQTDRLSYQCGNAMSLDFPDASFDRVMCLEAAFHFPDRSRFLKEAFRVLRPGGKLVVVDFAWNTDAHRSHREDPETRLVRHIWQWEDMYSISDYHKTANEAGFEQNRAEDWSSRVTAAIQRLFECVSRLGNCGWGRKLLERRNPMYRSFTQEDWKDAARAVKAHDHVRKHTSYMAFTYDKPAIR